MTRVLTPEQLARRKQGIGASEVASVLGLSPRTRLQLYESKIGDEVENLDSLEYIQWGNTLEPVIAAKYAQRIGVALDTTVILAECPTMVGEEPWELATPDRIVKVGEETYGLEIKVRSRLSPEWGPDGSSQVPSDVFHQCHWGMWVTGLRRWDVAALFHGTEMRVYTLAFDPEMAETVRAEVSAFWNNHVLAKVPPAADGRDNDKLAKYLPATGEAMLDVDGSEDAAELNSVAAYLSVVKARILELEAEKAEAEAKLKQRIGGAAGLNAAHWSVKWSPMKGRTSTDWEAVARELSDRAQLSEAALLKLVAEETKESAPTRRFTFSYKGDQ